ncbi:hypothetical protein OAU25_00460 [Crocinitomicaceae bacterium]|nr:hypothetical protein [Crocinitomicaceae bacterium]
MPVFNNSYIFLSNSHRSAQIESLEPVETDSNAFPEEECFSKDSESNSMVQTHHLIKPTDFLDS